VRRIRELGVRVVAGTDAGVSLTPFDSLPRELEILVSEAGLSPLEAIQAATGDAARAIGIADTLGTLQAGRAADLVAVDGDPSVRIADLRAVRRVIKGGRTVVRDGAFLE
jgi:imidazolonepropionase-like amidohydrolase